MLDKFNSYLKENKIFVESFHPFFNEALNYTVSLGGKHFRAQLLLGMVEALDEKRVEDSLRVALAVELFHTYSLIHDDLPAMDNADLRRGAKTLHLLYDETTAILAGDGLNTEAFYLIATSNLDKDKALYCIEILSKNGGIRGMVLGQAIDCYFENKRLNLQEVSFMHLKKTGALIAASLQMGAIIGGMSQQNSEQIYKIGLDLGLAFQINDDIIDATKSVKEAGKTTNNDINKNSFVNLAGLEGAKAKRAELIEKIELEVKGFDKKIQTLIDGLIKRYLKD